MARLLRSHVVPSLSAFPFIAALVLGGGTPLSARGQSKEAAPAPSSADPPASPAPADPPPATSPQAAPPPAPRPPPTPQERERAHQHFRRAEKYYEEGGYEAALVEMTEAYRLSQLPDLLVNLSKLSEKLGLKRDALGYLERYLAERPDAPDAAHIREEITRLQAATAPPPDQRPAPPPDQPPAGQAGVPGGISAPPPVVAPPPPALKPAGGRPAWLPPWGAVGLLGGGAVLLVVGGGLGGGAVAAARAVEDQSQVRPPQPFSPSLHATQERGKSLAAAGAALDVIGALALVGGATWTGVWLYQQRREGSSGSKARTRAALRPAGAGLVLTGEF